MLTALSGIMNCPGQEARRRWQSRAASVLRSSLQWQAGPSPGADSVGISTGSRPALRLAGSLPCQSAGASASDWAPSRQVDAVAWPIDDAATEPEPECQWIELRSIQIQVDIRSLSS